MDKFIPLLYVLAGMRMFVHVFKVSAAAWKREFSMLDFEEVDIFFLAAISAIASIVWPLTLAYFIVLNYLLRPIAERINNG